MVSKKSVYIIIGVCCAFITLISFFSILPYPFGLLYGIPVAIIVGVGISSVPILRKEKKP